MGWGALEDDALLFLVGLEQHRLDGLVEHVLQIVASLGRTFNVLQGLDLARKFLTLRCIIFVRSPNKSLPRIWYLGR